MIYEGLTRLDPNLETVPAAAKSWAYNDDATQLTFTLRPDLTYSDGSLLNAARFALFDPAQHQPGGSAGEYAGITDEMTSTPEWRS